MDKLNNIPAQAEQTAPAVPESDAASAHEGCCGCGGGCPCAQDVAPTQDQLEAAVDLAMEAELLPEEASDEALDDAWGAADAALPARVTVVDIHFRSGGKVYFFDPDDLDLLEGDHVIIDTARGAEFGICASGCHTVGSADIVVPLRKVLRIATAQDEKIAAENREKEARAYDVCQQKIQEHKLDMHLVSAECTFDGRKILFFFTADGRVDFRELVKNLASIFRTRIELRQIGVRDKAKMVGGLGVCGRPFCCSQFLNDFQPVSIKMAKTQNLSLNPTKISGTCGRLMCCLKYEQDAYEDLIKTAPKSDSFVDTPGGRGTVCDVNLLRQRVRVRMENAPETINSYLNSEIYVLRNGKAKKTDPPIPKDLAPISGHPKPARRAEPKLDEDKLMNALFKNLDAYAAAPSEHPAPPTEQPAQDAPRKRSRRRRKPSGTAKPEGTGQRDAHSERQPQPEPHGERKNQAEPRGERKKQSEPRGERKNQSDKSRQDRKPQQDAAPQNQAEGSREGKPRSNRRRSRNRRPKNPGGSPPAAAKE